MKKLLLALLLLSPSLYGQAIPGYVPDVATVGLPDARMSRVNEGDLDNLVLAISGTGVISGGLVTAQGAPNMTVAVAAGSVNIIGTGKVTIAPGNVTIAASDPTQPRWDTIYVPVSGTPAVAQGVAAASPKPSTIQTNRVILAYIFVKNGVVTITSPFIRDKRVSVVASITFPQSVAGAANSGGIPYFNSSTQMSSSAALTFGKYLKGGGAGGAPTASALLGDDNTNVTLSSGQFLAPAGSATNPGVSVGGAGYGLYQLANSLELTLNTIRGFQVTFNGNGYTKIQSSYSYCIDSSQMTGTADTCVGRKLAGIFGYSNASGAGVPTDLTTGTMTSEHSSEWRTTTHSYTWTNAMVTALGAVTAGDVKVATVPLKNSVVNAYVVITNPAAGVTTLTVSCGRVSASYIDYIVASDAKAAANTVYGRLSADRGTNLGGYDIPSYTASTDVFCHFISTGGNLSAVTGSTGRVVLVTTLIP